MATQYVTYDVDRAVCTITLNRPDKRNAVDGVETAAAARGVRCASRPMTKLRVAVLTGAGGHILRRIRPGRRGRPGTRATNYDPRRRRQRTDGADAHGTCRSR
jgi:enoyl-CoA hydratase